MKRLRDNLYFDCRAVAALEFVLVMPIFIASFFGVVEIALYERAQMQFSMAVSMLASTVAHQSGGVSYGSMQDFCQGAKLMIVSPNTTLAASIVSVTNAGGAPQLDWEYDQACGNQAPLVGAGTAVAEAIAAPNQIPNTGDSVVIVTGTMNYAPLTTMFLNKSISMTSTFEYRPTGNSTIICTNCGLN